MHARGSLHPAQLDHYTQPAMHNCKNLPPQDSLPRTSSGQAVLRPQLVAMPFKCANNVQPVQLRAQARPWRWRYSAIAARSVRLGSRAGLSSGSLVSGERRTAAGWARGPPPPPPAAHRCTGAGWCGVCGAGGLAGRCSTARQIHGSRNAKSRAPPAALPALWRCSQSAMAALSYVKPSLANTGSTISSCKGGQAGRQEGQAGGAGQQSRVSAQEEARQLH